MEEKQRILLCEDDENLGMLLREYLQAKGYYAELCPDGDAGYKAFLKGKFDLCVFDVMMPIKDGFTLAQEIRAVNPEIPIIFLTAKSLNEDILEGFTPAYLGRIGFFLFLITASYGQLDRIVDDGTRRMRPARLIALIAPVVAALIFVPNMLLEACPTSSKVAYAIVWIPAIISVYFNLKHALIPDVDFGFVRAIKPYNIFVLLLSISELLCLTSWNYFYNFQMILTACIFAILCILTMIAAKKGVEKWTI